MTDKHLKEKIIGISVLAGGVVFLLILGFTLGLFGFGEEVEQVQLPEGVPKNLIFGTDAELVSQQNNTKTVHSYTTLGANDAINFYLEELSDNNWQILQSKQLDENVYLIVAINLEDGSSADIKIIRPPEGDMLSILLSFSK